MTAIRIFVIIVTLDLKHPLFPENSLMGRNAANFVVSRCTTQMSLNMTYQW
jgi:hypothetical protein